MHGRIHRSTGGAVSQKLAQKKFRRLARNRGIAEPALLRKGVSLQPRQQLLAVGRDDVGLRVVHMRVDEAGQNQVTTPVIDASTGRQTDKQVRGVSDCSDPAAGDDHESVRNVMKGIRRCPGIVVEPDEIASKCARRHSVFHPRIGHAGLGYVVERQTGRRGRISLPIRDW